MLHLQPITALWACLVALFWSATASPFITGDSEAAQLDLKGSRSQASRLPAVWPRPQQISASDSGAVRLSGAVTIVTGNATDAATINAIIAIVSAAGGTASVSAQPTGKNGDAAQIIVGTGSENAASAAAAKALTGASSEGLAAEGYVLGSGRYGGQPTVVLNGADARGTFYAAQTLRQVVVGGVVPGVRVRDWPLMPIRGSIEGFYGIPWSHQARLDQYVFYGRHKMNTYVYTPKGDPYLRATWRELYGGSDLGQLRELVETANANHVDFTYALSPGLDLCYSSDADFNATVAKFEQLRNLGVSSFYIALDDIPLEFHCDSDKSRWPDKGDWHWIADAQAYYLNRVQEGYVKAHGLINLETVPTNYAGSAPDPYKGEFGRQLDKDIRVQWTGEGVFSDTVTAESVVRADSTYVTDQLFIWDNFPVNDGKPYRLFLNPLTGRDADLYKHLIGFTSNPMVQSYASMIALGNYGDYAWNGPAYNARDSWAAVIQELAGKGKSAHDALVAFVDMNQNWPYRNSTESAPLLSKDIADFWAARKSGDNKGAATSALADRLKLIAGLPDALPGMAMKAFATEVAPWSTAAMQWAKASQHLVAMLAATDGGDRSKADEEYKAAQEWVAKTKAKTVSSLSDAGKVVPNSITPITGDGVFDAFVANATAIYKGQ